MIIEAGHFALIFALFIGFLQVILPIGGVLWQHQRLMLLAPRLALMQFLLVVIAFSALAHAYLTSDFSVANVVQNSHSLKPLLYKWSGIWGNHEGSMLLWVLILAFFGAALAVFSRPLPRDVLAATLSVQAMVACAFLAFVIFTSNPFLRVMAPPFEGQGLNPVLQDPGLAIHPPLLYLGYVGFSIVFSFAVGALILGRIDAAFARMIRPWTLAAWVSLTLGIVIGAYWAYYELGWGGYWFWDPVENASLMPWLTGTALLHSAIVLEKRETLKTWTILLAIITFSLSLLGTFIVRSGVLTSVHSFAVDPKRGLFVLLILLFFVGGSLSLFAWRAQVLLGRAIFAPVSREGALVVNNLFLGVAAFATLTGTLYPLLLEAWNGAKISVGAPFFNLTALPMMVPIALFAPIGQKLAWKRGDFFGALQRLWWSLVLGYALALFIFYRHEWHQGLALFGFGLGLYVILGSCDEWLARAQRGGKSGGWSGFFVRLFTIPRPVSGMILAHIGIGVLAIGISASVFEREKIARIKLDETIHLGDYNLTLMQVKEDKGANYTANVAVLMLRYKDKFVTLLRPAKRVHIGRTMPTSEVARYRYGLGEIYVAVGEMPEDDLPSKIEQVDIRFYDKPLVLLVFIGPLLMALGGLLSLSDRKLRLGIPNLHKGLPLA